MSRSLLSSKYQPGPMNNYSGIRESYHSHQSNRPSNVSNNASQYHAAHSYTQNTHGSQSNGSKSVQSCPVRSHVSPQ